MTVSDLIGSFVSYIKQTWENSPSTASPLSADRLNFMETGIQNNSDAIESMASKTATEITQLNSEMGTVYGYFKHVTTYTGSMEELFASNDYNNALTAIFISANATGFPANSAMGLFLQNETGTRKTLFLPTNRGTSLYLITYDGNNDTIYQSYINLTSVS